METDFDDGVAMGLDEAIDQPRGKVTGKTSRKEGQLCSLVRNQIIDELT